MSDHEDQFAEMRRPAPEHQKLAPFAGTFRAEVSMWMGPGEPMVTTGTMVSELDLGGLFLKQTRSVVTLEDDDSHRMEMYFDTGEGEQKSMEIRYTRA